jgi:hypothetical protein
MKRWHRWRLALCPVSGGAGWYKPLVRSCVTKMGAMHSVWRILLREIYRNCAASPTCCFSAGRKSIALNDIGVWCILWGMPRWCDETVLPHCSRMVKPPAEVWCEKFSITVIAAVQWRIRDRLMIHCCEWSDAVARHLNGIKATADEIEEISILYLLLSLCSVCYMEMVLGEIYGNYSSALITASN